MSKVRVLLDVTGTEMNVGNKPVWICYSKKKAKNISDFKKLIIEKFNLEKNNFNLVLNGGILLESEGTGIFQKGDIVKLQYEENEALDSQTVKPVDLNKYHVMPNNYEDKLAHQQNPYLSHSSSYACSQLTDKENKYGENKFMQQTNPYLLPSCSSSYASTGSSEKVNNYDDNKLAQQSNPFLQPSSSYSGTYLPNQVNNYDNNKLVQQPIPFLEPSSSYLGTYLPEKINQQEENKLPFLSSCIKANPKFTFPNTTKNWKNKNFVEPQNPYLLPSCSHASTSSNVINQQEENKLQFFSSCIKANPNFTFPNTMNNLKKKNFVEPPNPYLLPSCSHASTSSNVVQTVEKKQTGPARELEAIEAIKNTLLTIQEKYDAKIDYPNNKLRKNACREDEKGIGVAKTQILQTEKQIKLALESEAIEKTRKATRSQTKKLKSIEETKKQLMLDRKEYEDKFKYPKDKLREGEQKYEEINLLHKPTPYSSKHNYAATYAPKKAPVIVESTAAKLRRTYSTLPPQKTTEANKDYQDLHTPEILTYPKKDIFHVSPISDSINLLLTMPKKIECIDLTANFEQIPSTSSTTFPGLPNRFSYQKEKAAKTESIDLSVLPGLLTPSTSASNYMGLVNIPLITDNNEGIMLEIRDKYIPFMKKLIAYLEQSQTVSPYKLSKIKTIYAAFTTFDELTLIDVFKANKKTLEEWYATFKIPEDEKKADGEDANIYNELIELNDVAIVLNNETFECPICFVEIAPGEGAVLKDCLHSFCKECLKGAIIHSNTAEVPCPFKNEEYTCDSQLREQEIKSLVTSEEFASHLQRSMTFAESQASNSFHCKTPDCPGWCFVEGEVNTFYCRVCYRGNCLTCAAIHSGQNCKEYQDHVLLSSNPDEAAEVTRRKLQDMVKNGEAMHCPKCQVIIMKKEGCDFLRCSMCRTGICWVTKGPRWGPGGDGDISGGCKCKLNGEKCHPKCGYCH